MAGGMGWGMVAQGVSDMAGAALGEYADRKAQKRAQEFYKHTYKHRYRWAMKDMQKAGINPILAAGFGGSSAPMPSYDSDVGERPTDVVSAMQGLEQLKNMRAQRDNLEANTELAKELQFKARAEGDEAWARGGKTEVERAVLEKQYPGVEKLYEANIEETSARAAAYRAQAETAGYRMGVGPFRGELPKAAIDAMSRWLREREY